MVPEWMSLLSSIIVLVAVYYSISKNSDSAKKFILIIVVGIFSFQAIYQGSKILDLELWGRNMDNIIPLVDSVVISLLFIFLLNHFKKAEKTLYVLMVIYLLIGLYGIYLYY